MKKTLSIAAMTAFTATAAMANPAVEIVTGCTADGKTAHVAVWSEQYKNRQDMQDIFENVVKNFTGEEFQNLDSAFVAATKDAFQKNGMKGNPVYKQTGPEKPMLTEGCAPKF